MRLPTHLGRGARGRHRQAVPGYRPRYKDADSLKLLAAVMDFARERGFELVDADCTIACEQPKIGPHREAMRANLAAALGVDASCVA